MVKRTGKKLAALAVLGALLILILLLVVACGINDQAAPVLAFSAEPDDPLTVQFTAQSSEEIESYAWDFDNDGTVDSTEQNPAYKFYEPGEYTVSVTIIGPGGSDTRVKVLHVKVTEEEPADSSSEISFPDANLEAAIRKAIGKPKGAILDSDLAALTSFTAKYSNISDLTGLEFCINLTDLNLFSNHLADVSPLANLTKLIKLDLGNNDNSINIAPLASLTNLKELSFASNWGTVGSIPDLSPLSNLTGLTKLDLSACYMRDVSALASLTNLTYLNLGRNQITGNDLQPLVNLVNLKELNLFNTPYSGTLDIAALVDNPGLSTGDILLLGPRNPSSNTINTYIPQLQARGVDVRY